MGYLIGLAMVLGPLSLSWDEAMWRIGQGKSMGNVSESKYMGMVVQLKVWDWTVRDLKWGLVLLLYIHSFWVRELVERIFQIQILVL